MQGYYDPLKGLQAVDWPDEVVQQVPGCSARFQSYTAVAAGYAVALVDEEALAALDHPLEGACTVSWVRGQRYLDEHWSGLTPKDWAIDAISR